MRARVLLLFLALSTDFGCSTQVPPNTTGGRCETDDQCDKGQGLVCRCVGRKNPDDEGPDEITSPGYCQQPTFKCSETGVDTDTGATDTGTLDTGAIDSATESSVDSAPEDAAETSVDASDAG